MSRNTWLLIAVIAVAVIGYSMMGSDSSQEMAMDASESTMSEKLASMGEDAMETAEEMAEKAGEMATAAGTEAKETVESMTAESLVVPVMISADGSFTPSTIEVPAGQDVTLQFKNESSEDSAFASEALDREDMIPAGEETAVDLGALEAGEYEFSTGAESAQGKIIVQ